ncbi:UNVERIFIED_CONTAM: hypothetical protein GTU68_054918 [Idotea baltica]|nr:hypothetical protein [Idotea baltica]
MQVGIQRIQHINQLVQEKQVIQKLWLYIIILK